VSARGALTLGGSGEGVSAPARPWDVLAEEYADVVRGRRAARRKRPCVYCGKFTTALNRVCLDHDDLPALDPGARQASL